MYEKNSMVGRYNKGRLMSDFMQPGAVGSVGDVLVSVRLHQSTPDMPMRWDPDFYPGKDDFLGSNVQDGQQTSWDTGFGGARVVDSKFNFYDGFRTSNGTTVQDLRPADMMVEPFVSSLGDYTWRNKVAETYHARTTGNNFLPLPGGYAPSPGEVGRGGNVPQVMAVAGGNGMVIPEAVVGAYGSLMDRTRGGGGMGITDKVRDETGVGFGPRREGTGGGFRGVNPRR
jgi:hypothetical protein